ncbi:nucleoside hydrolase, partial [Microbaculum marinum]|uniref:nucleoside hydrolase n=1 Tax=Microbaculum marinum TaxID=1764581 RepID=UPI00362084BA
PGTADPPAILMALADPRLDVLALTCVHGNKPLDVTTANALRILDLAGRPDVPVYAGADRPLLIPAAADGDYYGSDGLGDTGLPQPTRGPAAAHAVDALLETVATAPPASIWLCAIGPLTNVALAMRMDPGFASRLGGLVVMGGNVAPGAPAEFNIATDPAAAEIVFSSEAALTLTPYDVTRVRHASSPTLDALAASASHPAQAVAAMQRSRSPAGSALHDAFALATLTAPDLFAFAEGSVRVDWRDPDRQGVTHFTARAGGRHRVVRDVDAAGFERLLVASLTALT